MRIHQSVNVTVLRLLSLKQCQKICIKIPLKSDATFVNSETNIYVTYSAALNYIKEEMLLLKKSVDRHRDCHLSVILKYIFSSWSKLKRYLILLILDILKAFDHVKSIVEV